LTDNFKILSHSFIPNDSFRKIIQISSNFCVKVIAYVCDADNSLENMPKEFAFGWTSLDKPKYEYNGMLVNWYDWDNIQDICPSAIVIHTDGRPDTISAITYELNQLSSIIYTLGGKYIEISPANCNKGVSTEYVAKFLNLSSEQVLAMGDNDNDASMLSWAGIGVAVESASDQAKKNSDYITKGVLDGVIEVLRLVKRAKYLMQPKNKPNNIHIPILKNKSNINYDTVDFDNLNIGSKFISKNRIVNYYKNKYNIYLDTERLNSVINSGILPTYKYNDQDVFLKNDVFSLIPCMCSINEDSIINFSYMNHFLKDIIHINPYTRIDLFHRAPVKESIFYSAIKNLISKHNVVQSAGSGVRRQVQYFSDSILTTVSDEIFSYTNMQLKKAKKSDVSLMSQFASSAHYMGSKRLLCGFIIEAISSVLPTTGVVLDLMCGSGIVTGAFSKIWKTFSSDAQEFCRILSIINGGYLAHESAQKIIDTLLPVSRKHIEEMQTNIGNMIEREDTLFCRNTDEALLNEYKEFLNSFPTFPNKKAPLEKWDPEIEVEYRRKERSRYPYCLFTAYFSNVYFGLRQCVEIDSLRYAIDQLKSDNERNWALGALITTISALGTTYGGHFAQPKIKTQDDITLANISKIIEIRSSSITHEFIVRLLNISKESQKSSSNIVTIPGPWEHALAATAQLVNSAQTLVYLDAPYKREEYSRYYHVLETLVDYNYPSCTGTGLTPNKCERFRSEFFKRDMKKIRDLLIKIISKILMNGWHCAWSYSDSGIANIYEVITAVSNKTICEINSFSAPSIHRSQGGAKNKSVTEYLIVFSPK